MSPEKAVVRQEARPASRVWGWVRKVLQGVGGLKESKINSNEIMMVLPFSSRTLLEALGHLHCLIAVIQFSNCTLSD